MEGTRTTMEGKEIKTRNEETEGTRTTTTTRMFRKSLFTKRNSVVSMLFPDNVRTVRDVRYVSISLFLSLQIFTLQSINTVRTRRERSAKTRDSSEIQDRKMQDVLNQGFCLTEVDVCSFMMKVQMRLKLSRPEISQERLLEI